jgi:hypothetical protein
MTPRKTNLTPPAMLFAMLCVGSGLSDGHAPIETCAATNPLLRRAVVLPRRPRRWRPVRITITRSAFG